MSVIFYITYMIENYKLPSLQLFLIKVAGFRNLTGLLKCLSGNRLTHCPCQTLDSGTSKPAGVILYMICFLIIES